MNPGFRVKVTNLPSYASYQDVKKFLQKHLTTVSFRKLKVTGSVAFLTLETEDDVIVSVDLLNDAKFKKNQLRAKRAENEPELKSRGVQALDSQKQQRDQEAKSARQLVTPLADQPYADQLEQKFSASKRLFADLRRQLFAAHGHRVPAEEIVQKVLPSPIIEGYRNKCEFTVGFSGGDGGEEVKESMMEGCEDGDKEEDEPKAGEDCSNIVVGFISGKMATKQCRVVPADDCPNLSRNTKAVVQHFQQFVRQFGEQPFDEFRRTGFWKMLTVKDFMGDCMLICTVYPHPDPTITEKAKCALIECFLPSELETAPFTFNVTSLYWQEQRNASDERSYEHLAGTPFVYESLLGVSFRISPSTFFQTNSRAAALLYTKIIDLLELPASAAGPSKIEGSENGKLEAVLTENGEGLGEEVEEVVSKKPKMDTKNLETVEQENAMDEKADVEAKQQQPIVLLDICCGAGSIGLCLMHRLRSAILGRSFIKSTKQQQLQPFGCIGVELNVEAVRDARLNAAANGFDPKSCIYIDGQAEILFNDLQYHMHSGCSLKESRLLGIIDPPRAGLSDKVVIGCRKLNQLRELVYVSCDPKSATKNLVDLCRPISRKFEGEPFHIVSIHPVDIFPLTEHFEWVVKLQK